MKHQTLVRHRETGRLGVTVDPIWEPDLNTWTVVWEGDTTFEETLRDTFEVVGDENAVADLDKCGGGRGAECCIFLMFDAGGWNCERFGDLRYTLLARKPTMNSQREPVEMFPGCQIEA